ncbi:hypothetical protein LEP1GSC108_1034 [Leptospira weilii str. UI 13098]|uniref:Uncharacterized protein n=1 Tax=Leptospira weilii str. UI 13098 TaxID=1088542 RepID=M6Q773_9LEPT|nr:hypothetical protein LEP1GSC108_1034 [Leptospira weilii str. UI 13098]
MDPKINLSEFRQILCETYAPQSDLSRDPSGTKFEFRKALRLSSGSRCTLVSYSPKLSYAEFTLF